MKDRLGQFIDYLGIAVSNFEIKISASSGQIRRVLDKGTSMTTETLVKIHGCYPQLNIDWLVTGRGSMLYEKNFNGSASNANGIGASNTKIVSLLQEQIELLKKRVEQKEKEIERLSR